MRRSVRPRTEAEAVENRGVKRRDSGAASRIELVRSLPRSAFPALNAGERIYLEEWQRTVWLQGIDAVEDLTQRSWPCSVPDTIIGIFKHGEDQAAWLVVGQNAQWAVATCASGEVSKPVDSLAEALSLVCSIDADSELDA